MIFQPNAPERVQAYCAYHGQAWLCPIDLRELRSWLSGMLAAAKKLGAPVDEVEVHLVDDGTIAACNARNLHCCGPTNIISFPARDSAAGILLLSLDTFARECVLYGQPPKIHLARLLAHGMGHLAGYDHGPEMDEFCGACADAALSHGIF